MSNILERKFTPGEICDILYEGGIYTEEGEQEFETVDEELTYSDLGKAYLRKDYVIKDLKTGLFYKANLMIADDLSYVEDENCRTQWKEVQEFTQVIKIYK